MSIIGIKNKIIEFCAYIGITSHKTDIDIHNLPILTLNETKVIGNFATTGNLYEVLNQNALLYCRLIPANITKSKWVNAICDSYQQQTGNDIGYLKKLLLNRNIFKRFLDMGVINDFSSPVYRYFKINNIKLLGLPEDVLKKYPKEVIDHFIHYSWSEIYRNKINRSSGSHQLYSYNRSKCQEELYRLFGIERLICHQYLALLKGVSENVASVMTRAEGVDPNKFSKEERAKMLAPTIIRDLTTLNIMDAICYEGDHRPGNYNIVLNGEGKAVSIQAFDNDHPLDFFPILSVSKKIRNCAPIISNGLINRPHIDFTFAKTLIETKENDIKVVVKPYLNKLQIYCLLKRFHKIQKAVIASMQQKENFAIINEMWNTTCLNEELQIGATYYTILRDWEENIKDEILIRQGKLPKVEVKL